MSVNATAPLPAGHEIGGYRIVKRIASGGFAIVYLARRPDGSPVAIKEFMPAAMARRAPGELRATVAPAVAALHRNGLRAFLDEARMLARIEHPQVVRVLDFMSAHGSAYLVMDWEAGESLQARLGRAPLPLEALERLTAGLREVHAHGLLHLDVKPANLLLREDGSAVLLDFGASRRALERDAPALFPMYTPGYAAPELQLQQGGLGPWTDVYGFGATVYALLAGEPPPPAHRRLHDDPLPARLAALAPRAGVLMADLLDWCLRTDPRERPQGMPVLQRVLREALARARRTEAQPA